MAQKTDHKDHLPSRTDNDHHRADSQMKDSFFNDKKEPMFNSGIAYLQRISNLLWSFHLSRVEEQKPAYEFKILEDLDMELDPRMNDKERGEAETLRHLAEKNPTRYNRDYFIFLNRFAHKQGLIMKDIKVTPGILNME